MECQGNVLEKKFNRRKSPLSNFQSLYGRFIRDYPDNPNIDVAKKQVNKIGQIILNVKTFKLRKTAKKQYHPEIKFVLSIGNAMSQTATAKGKKTGKKTLIKKMKNEKFLIARWVLKDVSYLNLCVTGLIMETKNGKRIESIGGRLASQGGDLGKDWDSRIGSCYTIKEVKRLDIETLFAVKESDIQGAVFYLKGVGFQGKDQ
jgi:hypothetical protein